MMSTLLFAALCAGADTPDYPSPPREFRAVWVATVANIDWPSKKGLSAKQQQQELLTILDQCKQYGLNAVILQVRPMCDALYESKLEPWSEYLTGQLGKSPGYDPLAFAIKEAHARGLELHTWFNPYRAHHPSATSPIPDHHIVKKRPDLAPRYGKHHWLVPTSPEVQEHSLSVFLDVVRRYDIDGIHMDDYFYPYKEKSADGKLIPFPDEDSWQAYQKSGGKLSRDDWRRDAVNQFVERLYRETKKLKPHAKVGISPFGIWRPGYPPGIQGFDQFAELYADARLWLNRGWIDYWTPQLYWSSKQERQSYPKLLAWWASENTQKRHLWPGIATYRVGSDPTIWPANELAQQIRTTRTQPGASGNVHFSMKSLQRNTDGVTDLVTKLYAEPALVPASPWLGKTPPDKPTVRRLDSNKGLWLEIQPANKEVHLQVVRQQVGEKWHIDIVPVDQAKSWYSDKTPSRVVVTSIDRVGLESEAVELKP